MEEATLSARKLWWQQHKNDPKMVECMREARRKYYFKNHEQEKQRGREYYHKRKALIAEILQTRLAIEAAASQESPAE